MNQQIAWADKDKVLCGDFELSNVYSFCYLGHLFQGEPENTMRIEFMGQVIWHCLVMHV
jgi:hypothetical protein